MTALIMANVVTDADAVSLQTIGRMGRWLHQALTKSYLLFYRPEGLLAAGGWPGAASKDFSQFWAPRFCVEIDPIFISIVFPFFDEFQQQVTVVLAASVFVGMVR